MSLALQLDDRIHTPPIDDWVRYPDDIHARLVRFDLPTHGLGLEPSFSSSTTPSECDYASSYPRSTTTTTTIKSGATSSSSMAPTGSATLIHHATPLTYPPSLNFSYTNTEATPTETSISTNLADHLPCVPLLDDPHYTGILEIPSHHQTPTPDYECAFWFLNCPYIFTQRDEWETHCLSHFRGEEPPRTCACPLCDFSTTSDNGYAAWNTRMRHLAHTHHMLGQTLRTSRPDFGLYRHLWRLRLIDDEDLKELNGGNHNLVRGLGNFVETGGRGTRRARERRHRVQHAAAAAVPARQMGVLRV